MLSIKQYRESFLEYLETTVAVKEPLNLYEPVNYILHLGGKRLRPVLVLMTAEIFGASYKKALNAALAIEVFHNFTLLHDDIMDKAEVRRNKPTVYKQYNESTAILSGDAMAFLSYQYLMECKRERIFDIIDLFTQTALEVCEGQQYDMDFEKRAQVSETAYIDMIRLKTSVLLGCALQMGAIIAGADVRSQRSLYDFGVNLGIAFQLQDDILDVYGNPKSFGKQVGGDILSNKKTILFVKLQELICPTDQDQLAYLLNQTIDTEPEKVEKMMGLYAKYDIHTLAIYQKEKFTTIAYEKLMEIQVEADKKQTLFSLADALMHRVQ